MRLIKLHKSFKEFKAKSTTTKEEPRVESFRPKAEKPKELKPTKLVEKRIVTQKQPTRLREPYKSFSPVLSSTSKSVKNLMQTIKEETPQNITLPDLK